MDEQGAHSDPSSGFTGVIAPTGADRPGFMSKA